VKKPSPKHDPAVHGRLRRIEGRHNAHVKELRAAFAHGELTPDGYCAIEGMRILEEAIRSGLKFKAVFFRASAENRAERLLPQLRQRRPERDSAGRGGIGALQAF